MAVPVQKLFDAVMRVQTATLKCMMEHARQPETHKRIMAEARAEFVRFCAEHNLDVDFTDPRVK